MQKSAVIEAGRLIANARLNHTLCADLPPFCRPIEEDTAYAIQDAHLEFLRDRYGGIGGYKVGLVSEKMRRDMGGRERLGIDQPNCGGILSSFILEHPAVVPFRQFSRPYVEGEFALRIGTKIEPREKPYSRDEAADHVEQCLAGIELVDWRMEYFKDGGPAAPLMIADNGANWGAVTGPGVRQWRELDLANLRAELRIDGRIVATGSSGELQEHPFNVLAWLVNRVGALGKTLQPGDVVLLGAVTPSVPIAKPGTDVALIWEGLGEAHVRFE